MWSAWKWVSTTAGTRSTPSRRRQRSISGGSGPGVDDDAAAPWPALSTSPSPCPTSQATSTQPAGGQPGVGSGRVTRLASSTAPPAHHQRCASTRGSASAATRQTAASTATGSAPADQSRAAVGSRAVCSATVTIHQANQPATRPHSRPQCRHDEHQQAADQAEHRRGADHSGEQLFAAVVGPATVLGLVGGLLMLVVPALGLLCGRVAGWFAWWIVTVAEHTARLPTAALDWSAGALPVAVLAAVCMVAASRCPGCWRTAGGAPVARCCWPAW